MTTNSINSGKRAAHGNMTMFMVAIAIMLVPLLWFAVNYARILGGKHQQMVAIQAAALAAAQGLSRIVVDTPKQGSQAYFSVANMQASRWTTRRLLLQLEQQPRLAGCH